MARVVEEYLPNFLHLFDDFLLALQYLCESVHIGWCLVVGYFIKSIKFLKIGLIGFIEIAFDVCKVNEESIAHLLIRAIDARDGLQQIVVFEFTTEIQAFESWCIKSGEEHVENDEHIYGHVFLEVLDYLLSSLFVLVVVQD